MSQYLISSWKVFTLLGLPLTVCTQFQLEGKYLHQFYFLVTLNRSPIRELIIIRMCEKEYSNTSMKIMTECLLLSFYSLKRFGRMPFFAANNLIFEHLIGAFLNPLLEWLVRQYVITRSGTAG